MIMIIHLWIKHGYNMDTYNMDITPIAMVIYPLVAGTAP